MISGRLDDFEALGLGVLGAATRQAVAWIRSLPERPPIAEADLGDGMHARILCYPTGEAAAARFESHRRYVDLQYTIDGCEILEWSPRSSLVPAGAYDASTDLLFHQAEIVAGRIVAQPGYFTLFTPWDAHRGGIRAGSGAEEVRKLVVKIPVAEFSAGLLQ